MSDAEQNAEEVVGVMTLQHRVSVADLLTWLEKGNDKLRYDLLLDAFQEYLLRRDP